MVVAVHEASPSRSPILGLRLKTSSPRRRSSRQAAVAKVDRELLVDQARLLHSQDLNSYKCNDYLSRRRRKEDKQEDNAMMVTEEDDIDDTDTDDELMEDAVDAVCREKMCEWSYRVCDHFHAPRDIVAISFSYLDRFLDRCQCDRTTFKLAAMTTLYMANKTCGVVQPSSSYHHRRHNTPTMSIRTLANLSRGEFEMSHIAEMEMILLKTLGWKVNPPTVQAFVDCFLSVISVVADKEGSQHHQHQHHHDIIYQRAIFFSELAVYDYTLVAKERALIALVSILNAMEGMDMNDMNQNLPIIITDDYFCDQVQTKFGFGYPQKILETTRNRLWYIYGNTAQYRDEERRMMFAAAEQHNQEHNNHFPATKEAPSSSKSLLQQHPRSPVSVAGAADDE
jgi:hypothetical protein